MGFMVIIFSSLFFVIFIYIDRNIFSLNTITMFGARGITFLKKLKWFNLVQRQAQRVQAAASLLWKRREAFADLGSNRPELSEDRVVNDCNSELPATCFISTPSN